MFLEDEDFKSVWQLAHNWVDENPSETDNKSISPKLKTAIHRLMHAMACREISARSRRGRILEDDSFFSIIFDFPHYLQFYWCLRKNKFNKAYLDNLYVKRNEVINWCNNIVYLDLPPVGR